MADEPTLGEVSRQVASLMRAVEQLSGKVLTVDVWVAERKLIEARQLQVEKDIAGIEADAKADRTMRDTVRRQAVFALLTSILAPIVVGVILAVTLGS